mmetsp:Transcript_66462/g.185240  ORF Transcript_66462/g.185240 Transcript_66462/m.185240 type:complete len:210 (-) Transcript_66462:678-1307(-)
MLEGVLAPRVLRRRHLDHDTAEAPDVDATSIRIRFDNLWRHPMHRPNGREGLCGHVALRAAEVGELHTEVHVYKQVGAFEVSMDHRGLVVVQEIEAFEDPTRRFPQHGSLQWAKLVEPRAEGPAGYVFKIDVEVLADVVVAITPHDVRMLQALANLELSPQGVTVGPFAVVLFAEASLLHGYDLTRLRELRLEHVAEGTETDVAAAGPL